MKIGTVTEIKKHEYRVGLTPNAARAYISHGHEVFIQKGAGAGSSFPDELYCAAGCHMLDTAREVFDTCDMIVKVKEPLEPEYALIRKNQILYTYLHLAPDKPLTDALIKSKCIGIAFETIRGRDGGLPCLKPMSQIAGRLAVQEGAKYLENPFGGRGILLAGVPGVPPAHVVVLGAGIVGSSALKIAVGMGARVTVLDVNLNRLEYLEDIYGNRISTLFSSPEHVEGILADADLVIGAVLIPGASTPQLIRAAYLKNMKPGSVIVDVAIDQGGCSEASHVTYHDDPVYLQDGVVNYCVGNMPGAVSNTSTNALSNATLPYGLRIAYLGVKQALLSDPGLMEGLNVYRGDVTCRGVAVAHSLPYIDPLQLLK
ncbi:MAG: alanine dehydrogenase [Christensenella sp.]|nr:alanine dehydrogenase [Christensenella sp.]